MLRGAGIWGLLVCVAALGAPAWAQDGDGEGAPALCNYGVTIVGCVGCNVYVDGAFGLSDGFTFSDECGSSHCYAASADSSGQYVFTSWGVNGGGFADANLCTDQTQIFAYYDPVINGGGPEGEAPPQPEICDDSIDNNGNGQTDCGDVDCIGNPICSPPQQEICNDNIDNDGDLLFDCDDPDCAGAQECIAQCTYGVTIVGCTGCTIYVNESFGLTDGMTFTGPCGQSNCYVASEDSSGQYLFISWQVNGGGMGTGTLCTDQASVFAYYDPIIVDGAVDGEGSSQPGPEICDDGIDNDGNGFTDCLDTACSGAPACAQDDEEGEAATAPQSADQNEDLAINLSELLRVVQLYRSAGIHCGDETSEDGYAPGADSTAQTCPPHASDFAPQDWVIQLGELLQLIQIYNTGGYEACAEAGGYCAAG